MKKYIAILGLILVPSIAFAEGTLTDLVNSLLSTVNAFIPLLFGLGILAFLWGMVKFIYNAGDPKKIQEGKQVMLWGIIALAVMMSVWGLARVLKNTIFPTAPDACVGCGEGGGDGTVSG